jgi:hypothetical protein
MAISCRGGNQIPRAGTATMLAGMTGPGAWRAASAAA